MKAWSYQGSPLPLLRDNLQMETCQRKREPREGEIKFCVSTWIWLFFSLNKPIHYLILSHCIHFPEGFRSLFWGNVLESILSYDSPNDMHILKE